MSADVLEQRRHQMVGDQIEARGVRQAGVVRAMREVPRHEFVPTAHAALAYDDRALPIELDQTISQPYIVALTIAALDLKGGETILDIGTGSGYAAAVASRLAKKVYSIERHAPLAEKARAVLQKLGYDNVEVVVGDGSVGMPDQAPFDGIMVAAAAPAISPALIEQLAIGGRLIVPVGKNDGNQELIRVVRTGQNHTERSKLCPVRFVPLIGAGGF